MTTLPGTSSSKAGKEPSGAQYTPGPWYLDLRTGCLAIYPTAEIGQHQCLGGPMDWAIHRAYGNLDNDGTWTMDETVVANARLIAAAPELLEALQVIVAPTGKADFSTAWKQALAAIAKATGG